MWLLITPVSFANLALNHDEPPLVDDGIEVPFLHHYGQDDDLDIVGDIREIKDFFPPERLEEFHADLISLTRGENQAPDDDHWLFTTPGITKDDMLHKVRSNEGIQERRAAVHEEMRSAEAGQYRPRVLYTKWELSKSSEAQGLHKRFWEVLESPWARGKIEETVGRPMGHVTHSFISMFHKGDFLSTHAAHRWKGRGEWAYIFYLSKNWKPEYGGNLYFLNSQKGGNNTVQYVCEPEYNKMVLFRIAPHCPKHFVSQVRLDRPRLALTGWYATQDQRDEQAEKGLLNSAPPFLIPLGASSQSLSAGSTAKAQ